MQIQTRDTALTKASVSSLAGSTSSKALCAISSRKNVDETVTATVSVTFTSSYDTALQTVCCTCLAGTVDWSVAILALIGKSEVT